ncbi:ribosome biogenesis protein SLX9-domain-containing protein [Auriculariales sp. MPI-PUGE-AT-0066]|nr:ribosome biogenesis protein SLX9-domain-containing protein [Auriculariales sp. MPI-PUGE-AT-0066]
MPKERTKKIRPHTQSASLSSRNLISFGVPEQLEIGAQADASGDAILQSLTAQETEPQKTKKEKKQEKHEAWLQRVQSTSQPYSKSHARRLKKKGKEALSADMNDIAAVVQELQFPELLTIAQTEKVADKDAMEMEMNNASASSKNKISATASKLIGEGKGQPLSNSQRKRALAAEGARHPLILSNTAFKQNPFASIRTHVANTLVKHDASASSGQQ